MLARSLNLLKDFNVHGEIFVLKKTEQGFSFRDWFINKYEKKIHYLKHDAPVESQSDFARFVSDMSHDKIIYRFLDDFYVKYDHPNVGFKVMYNQLMAFQPMFDYFYEKGIWKIHIVRRNQVKREVSGLLKVRRSEMGFEEKDLFNNPMKDVKIMVDPELMIKNIKRALEIEEKVRERLKRSLTKERIPRYLEVNYEDITSQDEREMSGIGTKTIFDFFMTAYAAKGEEAVQRIKIPIMKQSHDDLQLVIENYEEVWRHFCDMDGGERYLKWLTER